jgi:ABC-type transporter Mla subunit MlaD
MEKKKIDDIQDLKDQLVSTTEQLREAKKQIADLSLALDQKAAEVARWQTGYRVLQDRLLSERSRARQEKQEAGDG